MDFRNTHEIIIRAANEQIYTKDENINLRFLPRMKTACLAVMIIIDPFCKDLTIGDDLTANQKQDLFQILNRSTFPVMNVLLEKSKVEVLHSIGNKRTTTTSSPFPYSEIERELIRKTIDDLLKYKEFRPPSSQRNLK